MFEYAQPRPGRGTARLSHGFITQHNTPECIQTAVTAATQDKRTDRAARVGSGGSFVWSARLQQMADNSLIRALFSRAAKPYGLQVSGVKHEQSGLPRTHGGRVTERQRQNDKSNEIRAEWARRRGGM